MSSAYSNINTLDRNKQILPTFIYDIRIHTYQIIGNYFHEPIKNIHLPLIIDFAINNKLDSNIYQRKEKEHTHEKIYNKYSFFL